MTKSKDHIYNVNLVWTGNPLTAAGQGTYSYTSYERSFEIHAEGKAVLQGSSDVAYRGDATKYNPEEMLVASLSSCHMLWYLHLCSVAGVVVLEYSDEATGIMTETADGGGYFKEVTLRPKVIVADNTMIAKANELHHEANKKCFIANSVNFPVLHRPVCLAGK